MASLSDLLDGIWRTPNRQMAWGRIPAAHVIGTKGLLEVPDLTRDEILRVLDKNAALVKG